jgi:alpha-tubulin suppressor-like RCC1 family protein
MDVAKIESLSNFVIQEDGKTKYVGVKQIECGTEHCMALMDVGAIYGWGGNEYGEQGN